MADRVVLQIEARLLDEATEALRAIGVEAEVTGEKGSESFGGWSTKIGESIVVMNQAVQLLGAFARALEEVGRASLAPINAAAEEEAAQVKLAATLRATQREREFNTVALLEYAEILERTTGFEGEAVMQAEALLLTYTNLGADVYPRVLRASSDLAALLGTDMASAAQQLGRALNEPTEGLSLLRRSGIAFTVAEKEMIRELDETNRTLEAQAFMLDVVEKRVGGIAETMHGTFHGSLRGVATAWDSFLESLGRFVTESPVVKAALKAVEDLLRGWADLLDGNSEAIVNFKKTFDEVLADTIPAVVRGFGTMAGVAIDLTQHVVGLVRWFTHLGNIPADTAAGFVTMERNLRLITEGEWQTRMKEIDGFFGREDTTRYDKIIEALERTKVASKAFIDEQAANIAKIVDQGSLLDRLVGDENDRRNLEDTKRDLREVFGLLADAGFESFQPLSVDYEGQERQIQQEREFQARMAELHRAAADEEVKEIEDHYAALIAEQEQAHAAGAVNEQQNAVLIAEIIAKRDAALGQLSFDRFAKEAERRTKEEQAEQAHQEALAAKAKAKEDKEKAAQARLQQIERDRVEFMRDLQGAIDAFEKESSARRLSEIERNYQIQREAVLRRATLLEIDAGSVEQYMRALDLEHARAVEEIVGTTAAGVHRALQELHDARETEFEAARNDTVEVVQASERALGDFLATIADGAASVEDKFKAMVGTILQEMARIAAQRAASQIFAAMGFADGGIMQGMRSGLDVRAFAGGGVARRPTMAVFAEVPGMAEAFVPLPDGQRIPVSLDIRGLAREDSTRQKAGGPESLNVGFTINAQDAEGFDRLLERRRAQIVSMLVEALNTAPRARDAVRNAVNGQAF